MGGDNGPAFAARTSQISTGSSTPLMRTVDLNCRFARAVKCVGVTSRPRLPRRRVQAV
jgi:hypothetical protein